jgi:hypothetical protein
MKIKSLLLTSAIFALSLASCSNDDDKGYSGDRTPILFNSTVEGSVTSKTKASNDQWDNPDYIGVFMKTGTGLGTIVDGADNKKYSTPGTGSFAPANPATDAIYFPDNGSNVDFISYYPHVQTLTNYIYKVDVGTQTSQEAIDLLYSNNATGHSKDNSTVNLNFKHQLSKVVFTISAGNGITDLTGLVVTMKGMNTKADYDLATGTRSNESAVADIVTKTTITGTQAVAEAIVIPMDGATGRTVTFALPSGTFTWDVPATETFQLGKKNSYTVELKRGGSTSVTPTGTIEDWGIGSSENIVLDLGEGGDGTQASPYTVSQLATKVGETGKWVTGYIVGSTSKTKAFGTPSTENILIAATATETDETNCIPVDISSSAVKANLDIVANADLIGKQVKIQGDIVNDIFSNTLSMTNITAQEGGATGGGSDPVEFFRETFGEAATTTKVNAYTGYDMTSPIAYSNPYSGDWADIRKTSKITGHLWLPAYTETLDKEAGLVISGIESGYTNMELSYDIASNVASVNANIIVVKCNDVPVTVPSTVLSATTNTFETITLTIPDGTTKIEFYSGSSNVSGYRLDNVVIKGAK